MEKREILINSENEIEISVQNKIVEIQREIERKQVELEEIKNALKSEMERLGLMRLECDGGIYIDYYPDTCSENFDSKRFREENPELYKQYTRNVNKKAFIKIWAKKGRK